MSRRRPSRRRRSLSASKRVPLRAEVLEPRWALAAPQAVADNYEVSLGEVWISADRGLLANDADADGDAMSVVLTRQPSQGAVVLEPNGAFQYIANSKNSVSDTFDYLVTAGGEESAVATVTVRIRNRFQPTEWSLVAGGNGHFYGSFNAASFEAARQQAAEIHFLGSAGHLTTLTTAAENTAMGRYIGGRIGGYQDKTAPDYSEPSGGWRWVTGEPMTFTAWGSQEPNNFSPSEEFMEAYSGRWNDISDWAGLYSIEFDSPQALAADDLFLTPVGTVLERPAGAILANDTPLADAPGSAALVSGPSHGTLTLVPDGSFRYTPTAGYSGRDKFTYRFDSVRGPSNVATVELLVGRGNYPTVTNSDSTFVNEDQEIVLGQGLSYFLRNDYDFDGLPLTATLVTLPQHGRLSERDDGILIYTPDPEYNGLDRFSYRATDGFSVSKETWVELTVVAIDDKTVVHNDAYRVPSSGELTVDAASGVFANDEDIDSPVLSAYLSRSPSFGLLTLNLDGSFSYTAGPEFAGSDSFEYATNNSSRGIVHLLSDFDPQRPFAAGETYSMGGRGYAVRVSADEGLLKNDVAVDREPLSAFLVGLPTHGTLSLNADGSFSYAQELGFVGQDSFWYQVTDGRTYSPPTRVDLLLGYPLPGALAQWPTEVGGNGNFYYYHPSDYLGWSATGDLVFEGRRAHSATITSAAERDWIAATFPNAQFWLGGYQDAVAPDYQEPAGGWRWVTGEPWDYTAWAPNQPDNSAPWPDRTDRLLANLGPGWSDEPEGSVSGALWEFSTFSELVPFIADDLAQYVPGQPLSRTTEFGVLANDEGLPAGRKLELVRAPVHGQLTLSPDGGYIYTPAAGFSGFDRYRYRVMNGEEEIGQAEVWLKPVSANLAPVASNDAYATDEDAALFIDAHHGVLANDHEWDGQATLSVVSSPAHGALELRADGGFNYRPNRDYFGSDSFVYRYTDDFGAAAQATATIEVRPINDPAVLSPDLYVLPRLGMLQVPVATGVLSNDLDVDTPALTATLVVQPQHGVLNLAADGSFTYEPDATFTGADAFEYRPEDGSGTNQQIRVVLTWQTDAQSPVALGDQFTFEEFALVERRVLDNDYDPQGRPLTAALVREPLHGRVSLADDGRFYYLPEGGFSGRDSFWYVARSAGGDSLPAEVRIEVPEGASPNYLVWQVADGGNGHAYLRVSQTPPWAFSWWTAGEAAAQLSLFGVHGDLASITSQAEQDWIARNLQHRWESAWLGGYRAETGDWSWASGEAWAYTAWRGDPPISAAKYVILLPTLADGKWQGAIDESARDFIAEVPLPASAQFVADDVYAAAAGATIEIATLRELLANDWNPRGSNVRIVSEPSQGSLIRTAAGGLQYVPAAGFRGRDRFTYRIAGPQGESNLATVWLNSGTNDFAPELSDVSYHVDENDVLTTTPDFSHSDYYQPFDGPALPAEFEGDRFGVTNGVVGRADWEYDRYYRWLRTLRTDYRSEDFSYEVTFNTGAAQHYDLFGASIVGLGRSVFVDGASERELVDSLYVRFSRVDRNGGVVQLYNQWSQPLATLGSISIVGVHRARIEKIGDQVTFSIDVSYDGLFKADMSYTVPSLKAAVPKLDDTNTRLFMASAVGDDWFDDVSILSLPRNGLSDYATDPEQGELRFRVVVPPAQGQVSLAADGSFRYRPNPDFVGVDHFQYTADDGVLTSYPATATIVVDPGSGAPLARPDLYRVAKNGQLVVGGPWTATRQVPLAASNLIWDSEFGQLWAFDSDRQTTRAVDPFTGQVSDDVPAQISERLPNQAELRIVNRLVFTNSDEVLDANTRQAVGRLPQRGINTIDEARERIYTLRGDQIVVVDARSLETLTTLVVPDVPLGGNTGLLRWGDHGLAFLAQNGRIVLLETNSLDGPRPQGVAENDRGRNDAGLRVSLVQAPRNGELSLSPDGSFRYAPKPGFVGQDRFIYRLTIGAATSESEVLIAVEPASAAPQATADRYELRQSRALVASPEIGVLANDPEHVGRNLTAELVSGPSHGKLRWNLDGSFHYEPNADFAGLDSFVYVATDGQLRSAPTEVQLQVHATLAQIELRAVRSRTADRTALKLPLSETAVAPGEEFYIEVWLQVSPEAEHNNGIGWLDLYFSTTGLQFVEVDYTDTSTPPDSVDRDAGRIKDFGSRQLSLDPFLAPQWTRMGTFKFRSAGLGPVTFTLAPGYLNGIVRYWSDVSLGDLTLSTFAGDTNYDNRIDLTDFGALKGNFGLPSGGTARQGDFNGDGRVDLSDFGLLKQNFGEEAVGARPIALAATFAPAPAAPVSPAAQLAIDASMAGPDDLEFAGNDADLYWLAWERSRQAVSQERQEVEEAWTA